MAPPLTPRERIKILPKSRTPYQKYTLTLWSKTPYPSLKSPTPEQAKEVHDRLMAAHGHRLRPAHITAPSLDVAGCGEVPQVLDAIVRTMISGNTTFEAADAAIQKLRHAVGTISERQELDDADRPKLEQCLDYMFIVQKMDQKQLAEAIKPAGGQVKTSEYILAILEDLLTINKERTEAFQEELSGGGTPADPEKILAANVLSDEEKQWEIRMFEKGIPQLEFLKKVSPEAAMNKMLGWKGIGVKTAACVLLFCMQQDILACDTHCVRLSKLLGWAPMEATDDLVFAHVDNRVPNSLKYSLHQLFIQHGKECLKCQKKSSEKTKGWNETVCPLDDLMDRSSMVEYTAEQKADTTARKAKKEAAEYEEGNDEEGEEEKIEEVKEGKRDEEGEEEEDGREEEEDTKAKAQVIATAKPLEKSSAKEGGKPLVTKLKASARSKTAAKGKAKGAAQSKMGNIAKTMGGVVKNPSVSTASAKDNNASSPGKASPRENAAVAASTAFDGPVTRKRIRDFLGIDATSLQGLAEEAPPRKKPRTPLKQHASSAATTKKQKPKQTQAAKIKLTVTFKKGGKK